MAEVFTYFEIIEEHRVRYEWRKVHVFKRCNLKEIGDCEVYGSLKDEV